jgi:hypothetical protein
MARQKKQQSTRADSRSPDTEGLQDKGRRGQEDQERDKAVYQYLLTLTDLGVAEGDDSKSKPNESYVAKQWGLEENRIFVRRVLRSVLREKYYREEQPSTVPGLTLGKLVKILSSIEKYLSIQKLETAEGQVPRTLTRAEKWRALRTFYQLFPEERDELGLPMHPGEVFLQRLLEEVTDPIKGLSREDIIDLYQTFLRHYRSDPRLDSNHPGIRSTRIRTRQELLEDYNTSQKRTLKERERTILDTIKSLIDENFVGLDEQLKTAKINDFYDKVQREIDRIEFQSGRKQVKPLLGKDIFQPSVNYLTLEFIERLTRSVVENEILTDEFPVSIRFFEIQKMKPLPLFVKREGREIGLLNSHLLDGNEEDTENRNGLENQSAYQVQVSFYIKIPKDYSPQLPDVKIEKIDNGRLYFFEEIIGVGTPLAHITAAINRSLLWDIPCLAEYLPTAKHLFIHNELMGRSSNSPIFTHTLLKLCKREDVNRAIREDIPFDLVDTHPEPAYGDYCGFDSVEVAAKSVLSATLRAIKQTGVNPKVYISELCYRVEELNTLRRAKNFLYSYPFSLMAMKGYLNKTIFEGRYRTPDRQLNFQKNTPYRSWSLVAYDAHLTLAEAYLEEGLCRPARKYLDILAPHLEKFGETISCLVHARYYLCLFRYRYLTDLQDTECPYSDRYQALHAAVASLEEAERWLNYRLKLRHAIDELPQTNQHPFFMLFSKIFVGRAMLYIYFSTYADKVGNAWDTLLEPVNLLEKARICSARDGNPLDYSYQSALQSWCYLVVAYLWDHQRSPQTGFSKEECIDWAKRLVEHALICYSPVGRLHYQELKNSAGQMPEHYDSEDKQGKSLGREGYNKYGKVQIQVVPFIRELLREVDETEQRYNPKNQKQTYDVLELDLSILKQINRHREDRSIYLFGTHSCILLFAMGILKLCEEQDADQLQHRIREAMRIFTYSWAIAKEGVLINNNVDSEEIVCDRLFEAADYDRNKDSLIQGLYPHRISQTADLGKLFIAVCKLLNILANPNITEFYNSHLTWNNFQKKTESDWQDIANLVEELHRDSENGLPDQALGQQRYNGHLAYHYEKIARYFRNFKEQLQSKKIHFSNLIEARDKIIKDVFKLIRGEEL